MIILTYNGLRRLLSQLLSALFSFIMVAIGILSLAWEGGGDEEEEKGEWEPAVADPENWLTEGFEL